MPYILNDVIFEYQGTNGVPGYCKLDIDVSNGVLIATEMPDSGPSVTNAVEIIANEAAKRYGIPKEGLVYFERYTNRSYAGGEVGDMEITESITMIQFNVDSEGKLHAPRFKQIDLDLNPLSDVVEKIVYHNKGRKAR